MPYSILHISDLHRSPEDPIGNAELLSTIQSDMDRWGREDPAIPPPEAIVVSGDLIRGVRLGHASPDRELDEQYDDAFDFLVRLADRVVAGDHMQVVLVPGNH